MRTFIIVDSVVAYTDVADPGLTLKVEPGTVSEFHFLQTKYCKIDDDNADDCDNGRPTSAASEHPGSAALGPDLGRQSMSKA